MSNRPHIIRTQKLDLQLNNVQDQRALQNRVAGLIQGRINTRIGDLFSELFGDEKNVLHLPQLVVDTGVIEERLLDSELEDRILQQLRSQLLPFRQKKSVPGYETGEWEPAQDKELHLLEFFLLHGSLPWWALERQDIQSVLNSLLSRQASALSRMLKRIGRYNGVVKRLVHQFSEEQIFSVIRVVEPAEASFIIEYAKELSESHRIKPLVTASTREFDKARLEFILVYIFSDRGTAFNRKSFVQFTLVNLAARYSLSYSSLLSFLVAGSQKHQLRYYPAALKTILLDLAAADAEQLNEQGADTVNELEQQLRFLDADSIQLLIGSALQDKQLPQKLAHLNGLLKGEALKLLLSAYREMAISLAAGLPFVSAKAQEALHLSESEIEEFVTKTKRKQQSGAPPNEKNAERGSELELVLHYIRAGYLPRAAQRINKSVFLNKLQLTIRQSAPKLRTELKKLPSPVFSARVIAHTLPQPVVEQLVQVLEPSDAPQIIRLSKQVEEVQNRERIIQDAPSGFKPVLWEFVFTFLLQRNTTRFNRKMFARHLLSSLAARYNIKYAELIRVISKAITPVDHTNVQKSELLSILNELQQDGDVAAEMKDTGSGRQEEMSEASVLFYYLQYGALPWWPVFNTTEPADFLQKILVPKNERFRVQLHTMVHTHPYAAQRLIKLLKGPFEKDVQLLGQIVNLKVDAREAEAWYLLITVLLQVPGRHTVSETQLVQQIKQQLLTGATGASAKGMLLRPVFLKILQEQFSLSPEEWKTVQKALHGMQVSGSQRVLLYLMLEDVIRLQSGTDNREMEQVEHSDSRFDNWPVWMKQLMQEFPAHRDWLLRVVFSQLIKGNYTTTGLPANLHTLSGQPLISAQGQGNKLKDTNEIPPELLRSILKQLVRERHIAGDADLIKKWIAQLVSPQSEGYALAADGVETLLAVPEIQNDKQQHAVVLWLTVAEQVVAHSAFNRHNLLHSLVRKISVHTTFSVEELIRMMIGVLSSGKLSGKKQAVLGILFSLLKDKKHLLISGEEKEALQRKQQAHKKALMEEKQKEIAEAKQKGKVQENSSGPVDGDDMYAATEKGLDVLKNKGRNEPRDGDGMRTAAEKRQDVLKKASRQNEDKMKGDREKTDALKEQTEYPEKEGIYVYNSGLVLLQPYIARLFTRLELVDGGKFKNETAAERAVHILEFLAGGREEAPEYDLVLNKVMCGIPVAQPVDREVQLTTEEKEICIGLLKAVITNWTILKSTSVEGLQQSFIQRKGKLVSEEKNWELVVEKKSYDVLIDKIPWSFNPVRFHWMDKPIYVQWR